MEVEADSLYRAVFAYNAAQVCGHYRDYPRLLPETEITVRVERREYRTTYGQAMIWANRTKKP